MSVIETHGIGLVNSRQIVEVLDDDSALRVPTVYEISNGPSNLQGTLVFHSSGSDDAEGITEESLLAILEHRLHCTTLLDPRRENTCALMAIREVRHWIKIRDQKMLTEAAQFETSGV